MKNLIERLIQYDIIKYLSNLNIIQDKSQEEPSKEDILRLCRYASILALSDKDDEQILAYEISTKIFINFYQKYPNLYSIVFGILSRLGNFPNRGLLEKYMPSEKFNTQNFLLDLEKIAREKENELQLQAEKPILLTDFQKKFFNVLVDKNFFSISAPTSAGKSFIFVLSIIKRLMKNYSEVIVLVVPTRALIKELSEKIIKRLKEYNLIEKIDVRVLPIMENESVNKGRVYVLTQERLNTLLEQKNIKIDTCFIDEAQEIQSNRGVVLQHTIEILTKKFPEINLFFSSPLIENPEYFNQLFQKKFDKDYFIESISPVGQNILLLSEIKNKPKFVAIDNIDSFSEKKYLGEFKLDFNFRGDKIILLAKQITKDNEFTLVYCNIASECEKKASLLAEKLDDIEDDEINNLINFIKEDIHKDYSIIKCLKKGIAYHYGYMPSSIRTEIERLGSKGKLKFIFCTSTLLQGVNLPAKNIIVSSPRKGKKQPMNRADFLNLIGRAGRLLCEFQGNVWCIEPNKWDNKSFEGEKLQKIEAFFENTLSLEAKEIIKIAQNKDSQSDKIIVFGKFYSDFVIDGKNIDKFQKYNNYEEIQNLLKISSELNLGNLPREIIKKHYSFHPLRLQKLYETLQSKNSLEELIPKKAYQKDVNNNLKSIFKLIDSNLFNKSNNQYKFFAFFASCWIRDEPISEIILKRDDKNKKINDIIREALEIIEKEIRYNYVIATHAYLDILKFVLYEKNRHSEVDMIPNLPLYLECGTSDKMVLNLISLGLSRLTSIKLKNSKQFVCDELTVTNCFNILQKIDVNILDIPEVCKNEIKRLIL